MPELPEVEINARNLAAWIGGKRVSAARVARTRIVRGASPRAVERLLVARRFRDVERRGKWIRIALEGGAALFSHLGMTGKWVRRAIDAPPVRAERARIDAARVSVRYVDSRMFGRLVPSPDGSPIPEWQALGRDPLRDGVDEERLAAALAQRRVPRTATAAESSSMIGTAYSSIVGTACSSIVGTACSSIVGTAYSSSIIGTAYSSIIGTAYRERVTSPSGIRARTGRPSRPRRPPR